MGSTYASLANDYLAALLNSDRATATRLVMTAVEQGAPVSKIYLEVFQTAQHRLGTLWENNEITVAQEHFATAVTQFIMSQLYPRVFASERVGRRLVATCVGGELHEIGMRMVADFFEMEGWDTYYLGANTPAQSVVDTLVSVGAEVLAVSTSMPFNIAEVIRLIELVRAQEFAREPIVIVGGRPFNLDPDLWRSVGADLFAKDAQEAVRVVTAAVDHSRSEAAP